VHIRLDVERCQGHGRCYVLAPDLFDADDYGHCVLLVDEVPAGRQGDARSGVENCPEQALSLED
jgi:ferredoxin